MSYFEKLSIQGIRCFGPDEGDVGVIKFGLPLTLILGNNGCGKTTIIEALNFATCGELPPGCSGTSRSNFVHDPKIMCRAEVKGQIRLLIKDVQGQTLSVTRTVQVTQKAAKAQFKSLDQVVSRQGASNAWHSITGRCADANTEMCLALGVSKAVLSNVLLCHQEDSNWPLDEDSKLKTKFDEIFGCDKYNKCLDQIRQSQKNLKQDGTKLKIELKNLEKNMELSTSMRARLQDSQSRLANYKQEVEKFASRLAPIQRRLRELAIKEDEISELRNHLKIHEGKLEAVRGTMADLRSSIQHEFKGTTGELEEAITNFTRKLEEKKNSLDRLESQIDAVGMKMARNQESLSMEQQRYGQLNGDLEANNKRIESRRQAMYRLAEELQLNTSVAQLSEADELQRVLSDLEATLIGKENELVVVREKHANLVSSLQKGTLTLMEKRADIDSTVRNKKDQLRANRIELEKVKKSIFEVDRSAELLGKLQGKLDRIKKDLEDLSKKEDLDTLKGEILSSKDTTRCLEEEVTQIEKQVGDLQLMSKVLAELDVQQKTKDSKDADIKRLHSQHDSALLEILQVNELPEQGLRFQLEARMDQLADLVKSKTETLRTTEKELAAKEAENKHVTQKLKDAKQQLESDEFAINQVCGGKDYNAYTAELCSKLGDLQDEKGSLSSAEHFFRRYVQKLQKKDPCCPLCKRDFGAEQEVANLVSELSLKVREVPSKLRRNKEELDNVQEKYEKLLQLKSKYEKVGALRTNDIPTLEKTLAHSNSTLTKLKQSISTLREELEHPEMLASMAKTIHSDVALLEQYLTDSRSLAKELLKIQDKLKHGSGTKKTLQEAIAELKEKRGLQLQSRRKVEVLENKLRTIEHQKIKLQEEKHSIQDQQFKISGNVQQRNQLSEKRDDLEGVDSVIQQEIDQMTKQLTDVSRQIEQSERKVKSLQASNSAEIDELNKKLRDFNDNFRDIKQLNSDIVDYELSGGLQRLKLCKQAIEQLQKSKDGFNTERETLVVRCDSIKSDLASQETRERELNDNMKLRVKLGEEKELVSLVDGLNRKIGNMNCLSIVDEKNKLKSEEGSLYLNKQKAEGSLVELESSIKGIEGDLEEPHLKYAEKHFRDTTVHYEVIEQAGKDLENFYKAIDWSMMNYHQKKIRHINRVINEWWRRVYSGNDIDAINILAEPEASASESKRRAFRYRIIQTKCGSNIEMRNRCSAGQKVLACLIIRIALAETFSSHCGVLALDEPTTNLDQENIVKLSANLMRVVQMQATRKSFQLMVITHDQDFLKELTKLEAVDHFYKLERNAEGKSQVTKVKI